MIPRGHVWNGDACTYIHHAKNLVEGVPYRELFGLNLKAMKASIVLCFWS